MQEETKNKLRKLSTLMGVARGVSKLGWGIGKTAAKTGFKAGKGAMNLMGGPVGALIYGGTGLSTGVKTYKDTGDLTTAVTSGIGSGLATAATYGATSLGVKGLSRMAPGKIGKFLRSDAGSFAGYMGLGAIPGFYSSQERMANAITGGIAGAGGYIHDAIKGTPGESPFKIAQEHSARMQEAIEQRSLAEQGESNYLSKLADMQMVQGVRNSIPVMSIDTIKEKMDNLRRQAEIEDRYRNPGIMGMTPIR